MAEDKGNGGIVAIVALTTVTFIGAVISAWDAGREYGIRWERQRVKDKEKQENGQCR